MIFNGEDPDLTSICWGSILFLVRILFSFDSNSLSHITKPKTKENYWNTTLYSLHASEWECFCILDSRTIWYARYNVECTKKVQVQSGVDPGFFLGGGALVSCSTSTPINHIVFFFAEYQCCIRKPQVTSGCRGQIGPWQCNCHSQLGRWY